MLRKVLIVGDSLSMSRVSDGLITTDTYAAKLQLNNDVFVVNASARGLDANKINSALFFEEHVRPLIPDVVILAIGIVDCTPRIFTEFEHKALSYLSRYRVFNFFIKKIVSFFSKHRLLITKYRSISYVPAEEFKEKIVDFIVGVKGVNPGCQFLFVNILSPSESFSSRNYGFDKAVEKYNKAISSICLDVSGKLIDLHDFTEFNDSAVLDDGYHITCMTHDFIYKELKRII